VIALFIIMWKEGEREERMKDEREEQGDIFRVRKKRCG
jgi:hypothetical protein